MAQSTTLEEPGGTASPERTIEVHGISDALLRRLDERARESGRDRSQVIQAILIEALGSDEAELNTGDFDAALAPIRQGFAESGLSEDKAIALLEEGLRAVRRSKRSREPALRSGTLPAPTVETEAVTRKRPSKRSREPALKSGARQDNSQDSGTAANLNGR